MLLADTIVAISSATGPAPRMIVRLSGPESIPLLHRLADVPPAQASAFRGQLRFDRFSFPAWFYVFRAPGSYTAQDALELHIPGNPLLARLLLQWLAANGARLAEPGEFTARAFFSGKLDLAQSEGVSAIVSAHNARQLSAARQLMAGELSHRLGPAMDLLSATLALVEVGIDFSEEQIEFIARADLNQRVRDIDEMLRELQARSNCIESLNSQPSIVLAGRPNAGKSSLVNALSRRSRALVSPIAGTTRDVLSAELRLPRGLARIVDVPGFDRHSDRDPIAVQMQQQFLRTVEQADVVVLVQDVTDARQPLKLDRSPDLHILSKCDLTTSRAPHDERRVSVVTGEGLDRFRAALDRLCFGDDATGYTLALTARHLTAIADARAALSRARSQPAAELLAADLRQALDSLGHILGQVAPDDILGRVFSTFCIGK